MVDPARLANPDQLASAVASVVAGGPADGCRALDLRVFRGIDVRILPDRGFDIGAAWYLGVPLAWSSAVGETAPLAELRGDDWRAAFGGGLVTTCGLRNVGAASEGHGLHGTFSHLHARDMRVERRELDGEFVVSATAVVDDAGDATHLRVERTIRTRTGRGLVELEDVTRNLVAEPEPAPILYHVNLGAPLWDDGAELHVASSTVVPRDADAAAALDEWAQAPEPQDGARERVFEHEAVETDGGWGECGARERAAASRSRAALGRVDAATPSPVGAPRGARLRARARARELLGTRPGAERAAGRLPMLAPGEARTTRLTIEARAR